MVLLEELKGEFNELNQDDITNFSKKIKAWQKINLPVFKEWDRKIRKFFDDNPDVKSVTFRIGDSAPVTIYR